MTGRITNVADSDASANMDRNNLKLFLFCFYVDILFFLFCFVYYVFLSLHWSNLSSLNESHLDGDMFFLGAIFFEVFYFPQGSHPNTTVTLKHEIFNTTLPTAVPTVC